jgi:hypothetical protein
MTAGTVLSKNWAVGCWLVLIRPVYPFSVDVVVVVVLKSLYN